MTMEIVTYIILLAMTAVPLFVLPPRRQIGGNDE